MTSSIIARSFLLIILAVLPALRGIAQLPDLDWARSFGGTQSDVSLSHAVDNSGNVIIGGHFSDIVDFDPGPNLYNLTSAGSYDIFIQKLDSNGNFLWAKSIGGAQVDFCYSMTVDSSGCIYLTGIFMGAVDFDPGPANYTVTNGFGAYHYILKLDSAGNFLWVITNNSSGNQSSGNSIHVDRSQNVLLLGHFYGTVDFDPSANSVTRSAGSGGDIFIQKVSRNGVLRWVKHFQSDHQQWPGSITTDANENIYLCGQFRDSIDCDPGTNVALETSNGGLDVFVAKLSSSGAFNWSGSFGGSENDDCNSIVSAGQESIYIAGSFVGPVDFDMSSGFNIKTSSKFNSLYRAAYLLSVDTIGNLNWVNHFEVIGNNPNHLNVDGASVDCDDNGNVFFTGVFSGTIDLDPGAGTNYLTAGSPADLIIQKLSPNGLAKWTINSGINGWATGKSIFVRYDGSITLVGGFGGAVDFEPGPATTTLFSMWGSRDIFVLKLSEPQSSTLPVELLQFSAFLIEDHVELNWITASESDNHGFEIYRSVDGINWNKIGFELGAGTTSALSYYQFDDQDPQLGTNYYRLKQLDINGNFEWSEIAVAVLRQECFSSAYWKFN